MGDLTIEQLKQLEIQLKENAKQTEINTSKIRSFFDSASEAIKQYGVKFKEAEKNMSSWSLSSNKDFDKFANGLNKTMTLMSNFKPFENLKLEGSSAINTMSNKFDALATKMGGITNVATALGGKYAQALSMGGEKAVKQLLDQSSQAEILEHNLLGVIKMSGELGKYQKQMGDNYENLNKLTADFGAAMNNSAKATGYSVEQVTQWAMSAKHIRGFLDHTVEGLGKFGEGMSAMTAAIQLSRSSSQDMSIVLGTLVKAYEDLGNAQGPVTDGVEKGLHMFSLMQEATDKLGIRFEDTQGYLTHVADAFKFIGDNTQGATNILARFSGALQNTGLTAKASVDIIQGMVDSVNSLSIGTKALISQRTGGPGGLQGAFQIENLLRQGKVDEVAKKMEQTLRQQFGGKIYSLEEAARSPQAASQFMRQRELLKSGAFGGLAKTDETANRLLEALSKGPTETANALKSADEALKDNVAEGTKLTERTNTILDDMNTSIARGVIIQEQQLLLEARSIIGTGKNEKGEESAYAQELIKSLEDTVARDVDRMRHNKQGGPPEFKQLLATENRAAAGGFGRSVGAAPEIFNRSANLVKDYLLGASELVGGSYGKNVSAEEATRQKTLNNIKLEQERSQRAAERGAREMAARAMRQRPANLAAHLPNLETTKHEVEVKPIKVDVTVNNNNPTADVQVKVRETESVNKTTSRTVNTGGVNTRINPGY